MAHHRLNISNVTLILKRIFLNKQASKVSIDISNMINEPQEKTTSIPHSEPERTPQNSGKESTGLTYKRKSSASGVKGPGIVHLHLGNIKAKAILGLAGLFERIFYLNYILLLIKLTDWP